MPVVFTLIIKDWNHGGHNSKRMYIWIWYVLCYNQRGVLMALKEFYLTQL